MSEEETATATAEGSQEAGSAEASAQAADPSDFDTRLRTDPDFAVTEFKKQQASASRANDRLRKGQLALEVAERLGGGDLTKGSEQILNDLAQFRQMQQNPEMAGLIQRWQSGQPLTGIAADSTSSAYGSGFEEDDPREQMIRSLQGTTARLEQKLMVREMADHMKAFGEGEIGKHLTGEEKQEIFEKVGAEIRALQNTPMGREQLRDLQLDTIEILAMRHLKSTGKWLEVGARAARQRAEAVQQRETDVPSRVNPAAMSRKPNGAMTPAEAWDMAKRELGIA